MKALTKTNRQAVVKAMPKKFNEYQKLEKLYSKMGRKLFSENRLIKIDLDNSGKFTGRCFIDTEKQELHEKENRKMYWHPQHYWRVELIELEQSFNYDLMKEHPVKLIPTEVELSKKQSSKLKSVIRKGRHHLHETKKAYNEYQEIRSSQNEA
jgi:hypothetical protein